MQRKITKLALVLSCVALSASAADFGGHVGYYGSDVQKAAVGVNLQIPIGIPMVAISPNLDYSRDNGVGLWLGGADVALRFGGPGSGTTYWVGAGPTYGYLTSYGSSSNYARRPGVNGYEGGGGSGSGGNNNGGSHTAFSRFSPGSTREWGWDVNAGVAFSGSMRPYLVGRYNHVGDMKTAGAAVGIRFGK